MVGIAKESFHEDLNAFVELANVWEVSDGLKKGDIVYDSGVERASDAHADAVRTLVAKIRKKYQMVE